MKEEFFLPRHPGTANVLHSFTEGQLMLQLKWQLLIAPRRGGVLSLGTSQDQTFLEASFAICGGRSNPAEQLGKSGLR